MNYNCSAGVRHAACVRLMHDIFRPKYVAQWYVAGLVALSHEICACVLICVHFYLCLFVFSVCSKLFFFVKIEKAVIEETKLLFPSFYCTLSFVTNANIVLDVI